MRSLPGALTLVACVAPALAAQTPQAGYRRYEQQNVRETTVPGDSVGRLSVPQAVQERARTTARDDDSLVQAIEHQIHCTCGCNLDVFTCRTTDFTCATSPAMHRVVLARLDSNMTAAQVVAAFEAQYGPSILMEPPKRGFNWTAYVTPFIALAAGLLLLGLWMRRWVRATPATPLEAPAAPSSGPAAPRTRRAARALARARR